MISFRDVTFIIPLRIDFLERLENAKIVLNYLLYNFDTNIIVYEDGEKSHATDFEIDLSKIHYIYKKTVQNSTFHRMRYLNEMLVHVQTKVVVNYDIDIILPPQSYITARDMIINQGYKIVQPFCNSIGNRCFYVTNKDVLNQYNFEKAEDDLRKNRNGYAGLGFAVFLDTYTYKSMGGENEDFLAYGPEDQERFYRFNKLGYKTGIEGVNGPVFHLEHPRTPNSWSNNPHFQKNFAIFNGIKNLSEKDLRLYYQQRQLLFQKQYPMKMLTMNNIGKNGRLANQMFQWAALRSLSIEYNCPISLHIQKSNDKFKTFRLDEAFCLPFNPITNIQNTADTFTEPKFSYSEIKINKESSITNISGYFQSFKYFAKYEDSIRSDFVFKKEILQKCSSFIEKIKTKPLIAIHVRRSDYVNSRAHITLNKKFCENALSKTGLKTFQLIYFSDEIEWCKNNLPRYEDTIYSEHTDIEDLCLMTLCDHYILSASTFGWWGAWLSTNKNKIVIVPRPWFIPSYGKQIGFVEEDIIPKEWIKLDV